MDYVTIPSVEVVQKTAASFPDRGFSSVLVNTKEEALEKIKELVPAGASIMNGSSTTLNEIGFVDYLKSGQHPWKNLHEAIANEKDPGVQAALRRQALLSDFYVGSVHALTEGGELVIGSNSGSQLPHLVFSSPNIILVVSTNKITPNLDEALKRLREYVLPLESIRLQGVFGIPSYLSKTLIFSKEQAYTGRKITIILVNEKLGF